MKNSSAYNGFTLIEVLITLAILGILAAIAIPAYNGYITTARMSEAETNLAAIRLAEEEYFLEENEYFEGTTTALVESNSNNLWKVTKGANGYNFNYVVNSSNGWTATATGKIGTPVEGKTRTVSKE